MSLFLNQEDGYYSLTTAGMAAFLIIIAALVLLTAFFRKKDAGQAAKAFSTRQLVFSAVALALGFVTSYIKIIHMPWGGSVTLCSMLFVTLIGYWYGPKVGLTAGFAYGILQFLQGGGDFILSPLQVCMDYILAFAALGLSGFFSRKKHGLLKGYFFAVFVRGLFHTIGGYLYWMEYMPESFPESFAFLYPFAYNYAYLLVEAFITAVILSLPPVNKAMLRVKTLATE
ncbi:MAG: energy-coupled thiamine transporter ThiT [Blautia sp.]|nr:energy-coupled thiamine transporter ThiT [Blautia sp.]MCM1200728.1 energy-coupled thiamine transporter ThiT [Bacteroides fragilis]